MVWSREDFLREVHRQIVEILSIKKRLPADADVMDRLDLLEESHHYLLRKLEESFGPDSRESDSTEARGESPRSESSGANVSGTESSSSSRPDGSPGRKPRPRRRPRDSGEQAGAPPASSPGGSSAPAPPGKRGRRPKSGKPRRPRPDEGGDGGELFRRAIREHLSNLQRNFQVLARTRAATAELRRGGPPASRQSSSHDAVCLPSLGERCAGCGRVLLSSVLGGEDVVAERTAGRTVWYHRKCLPDGDGYGKWGALN